MSTNFGSYSQYYDLFYVDKDYSAEVAYIKNIIMNNTSSEMSSFLELGCGTGIHACLMASDGIEVLGVDSSDEMLNLARERKIATGLTTKKINFEYGDARTFRVKRKFDVVASLFHVVSYQTSESDLNAIFDTAYSHLETVAYLCLIFGMVLQCSQKNQKFV